MSITALTTSKQRNKHSLKAKNTETLSTLQNIKLCFGTQNAIIEL